jgi:hypothetical protein
MPTIVIVQAAAHVRHQKMAKESAQVVYAAIHATMVLRITAESVVKMSLMPRLHTTAAQHAALNVTMDITNPAAAVHQTPVQTVQHNALEEFLRRVPVAYGQVAQSVLQIKSVAVAVVQHVHLVSMFIKTRVKMIA